MVEKKRDFIVVVSGDHLIDEVIRDGYEAKYIELMHSGSLEEIGLKDSFGTLFCMDEDYNKNLFVTLSARNLNKNLTIISRVSTHFEEQKILLAGANYAVNPYELGSLRAFRLITKPRVFDLLDSMIFKNIEYKIDEIFTSKKASIIGVEFNKLTIESDYDLLLLGIKSNGKFYYNTYKITRKIREGDIFVVAGKERDIKRLIGDIG